MSKKLVLAEPREELLLSSLNIVYDYYSPYCNAREAAAVAKVISSLIKYLILRKTKLLIN